MMLGSSRPSYCAGSLPSRQAHCVGCGARDTGASSAPRRLSYRRNMAFQRELTGTTYHIHEHRGLRLI